MKLDRDARLLFLTRALRMFGYGFVSIVLVLYLAAVGLSDWEIGLVLTLTLLGDAAISLWLTTHADRVGRRRVLLVGALLMALAGLGFAATSNLARTRDRGDDRRDKPERQRNRTFPGRRASVPVADGPGRAGGPASSPGSTSTGSFATAFGALGGGAAGRDR